MKSPHVDINSPSSRLCSVGYDPVRVPGAGRERLSELGNQVLGLVDSAPCPAEVAT